MLQRFPMYAYIPAHDVGRARKFYEGVLGFKPGPELADGVTYEFGGGTACFLYPSPNAGTSRASQAYWQVQDIERVVGELRKRGVRLEEYPGLKAENGVVTDEGVKAAWFKDTEGNTMALIECA